jgi:MFS superfamily sulfate permease-like transporter
MGIWGSKSRRCMAFVGLSPAVSCNQVDIDQEHVAQAFANGGAGLFQGMPVSRSLSASSLNDHSGARNFIDSSGSAMSDVVSLTDDSGITLRLARLKPAVSATFERDGVLQRIGAGNIQGYVFTGREREGRSVVRSVARHPEAEQLPGCPIFRFDAPLIFANARTFRDQIRAIAKASPSPDWIVVAAEPLTDIDTPPATCSRTS